VGEGDLRHQDIVADLLRLATLALVTFVVFGATWSWAAGARAAAPIATRTAAPEVTTVRAESAARGVLLSGGVPVTLVDGGRTETLRVPRGASPLDVLELAGVTVGPLDTLQMRSSVDLAAGDVVRVVRGELTLTTIRESVPFTVKTVADNTMALNKVVVVTPGQAGEAANTYQLRLADGVETERTLVSTDVLVAPVTEVRRVGTFVPTPPPAPVTAPSGGGGDIGGIIRAAAAAWGANADQMLRVAYCESHYNPSAVNASSGASGLFQFLPSTWAYQSPKAGYAGASPFDPVANANTAAMMFAHQQASQWVCK